MPLYKEQVSFIRLLNKDPVLKIYQRLSVSLSVVFKQLSDAMHTSHGKFDSLSSLIIDYERGIYKLLWLRMEKLHWMVFCYVYLMSSIVSICPFTSEAISSSEIPERS
ncbi:hypothetical protein DsansV1_C10g0101811 [Dioscorea sansibarensis]